MTAPRVKRAVGKQSDRAIARILEVVDDTALTDEEHQRLKQVTLDAVRDMERRVVLIVEAAEHGMTVNELLLDREAARR